MIFFIFLAVFFQVWLGAWMGGDQQGFVDVTRVVPAIKTVQVTVPGSSTPFIVEIADDDEERARGLMYREKLAKNQGMLFVFPKEEPRAFWMKNTLIPLDMIFLDGQQTIVSIQKQAKPCGKQPVCPLYESRKPAKYVLEINGGVATKLKLKEGEKITLDGI